MTEANEGYIFRTTDYNGKTVVLTSKTFYEHILPGHPEMEHNIEAIKECIENPDYVIVSKQFENSSIYVTKTSKATYRNTNVKTIVNSTEEVGYVRTSFFQRNLNPENEGRVIYPDEETKSEL